MTPSYLPYQLIQAHLPAPPLPPLSIPQIRVHSRHHFPVSEELAEPLHPDHGLSSSYNPDLNVIARVIQNGYGLELRPFDLYAQRPHPSLKDVTTPGSDTLRILFPHSLRPLSDGTIILSQLDRKVYILVVSQADIVYCLSFPLDGYRPQRGARFQFVVRSEDWVEEYEIPEDVGAGVAGAGPVAVVDAETVVLGGVDGGLVKCSRISGKSRSQSALRSVADS